MSYKSTHTGAQIDAGVSAALNPDATPTLSSTNLVTSGGVAAKLSEKQDTLVFDNAPQSGSNNPVKSYGIYDALALKADKTDVATADAALEQMILASFPNDTISNVPVASFPDGADGIPVKALTVNITPVQAGSGDPSPDNVRPISGWTGAVIYDTRDSIWNELWDEGAYWTDGVNAGQPLATTGRIRSLPASPISVTGNTDYVFYAGHERVSQILWYDTNDAFISAVANAVNPAIVKSPANAKYLRFMLPSAYGAVYQNDVIVATGATFSVSWQTEAGTVYGGTLTDNGDGTWTLTKMMASVDLGTLEWTGDASQYKRYYSGAVRNEILPPASTSVATTAISEKYAALPWDSMSGEMQTVGFAINNTGVIFVRTALSAPPTPTGKLVYPLATAQTYTLTAESVKTLLGDNNIFADCGDIAALDYRADVGLYIAKKLAEA